ncbi:2-C-methyl-D-erythritol 2,4-cyclodiphosphate synthase [Rhodohalobacter barkolensis]|uniref:2-C-methyl-D-erythritol 2,4-cyclodiphosphate synthase n=1 Tax=Rhodohalobacter barkolensis TaxID=2053187 RepID=A0A2N0VF98_9BACT|nr:2-C-methyl-D-erythritol 2,4-cyclodiphosphate synthase [Rhodohalobacter barkolensis]PKD42867.1 2-C-methyl-D-erythritol 2,4-cyclodiphosphate synthase [Rhodohalobacter barkolensis]
MDIRIGYGYDVHAFEAGEELVLGGVKIPFQKKLKGHSDADVLLHAITDALLGALALGDIGVHFPDTDPEYKGADSLGLLEKAYDMVLGKGYSLSNLDATIIAEAPKLNPFIPDMAKNISSVLKCNEDLVSIKATTGEKMGFVGRGEGIAVQSVVLVKRD